MKNVVLLGPPGAGKGTQAKQLAERYHLAHISTGDLVRRAVKDGTANGQKAKSFMESGALVPDVIVLELLREALPENEGVLFDGYPRNVSQAKALDEVLKSKGRLVTEVVNLDLSDDEVVKRLSGRRQCANGHIFNTAFAQSKKVGICDTCGKELFQRPDDQAVTIRERLAVYHRETQPLIDLYAKRGLLHTVDGGKSPEDVRSAVERSMKEEK